ncbi:hypothetical protein ABFS82_12G024800 [Erythranthe guttata]|uniref:Uncharacterized protein n=1 Tax=Erythranthe guttata TaxID=4155 RepID=A0A022RLL3_ERYGU|nr:hypothetical protein MIMGU_mgv1a018330mg [Erythranthe guttata]
MSGGDIYFQRRSSYFSGGCMSPSCVPVHEEYSRIHVSRDDAAAAAAAAGHRRRKLRRLLRKIVNEGKNIYGPPASFQYDAVSYSQNFDDGGHGDAQYCQQVFRDLKRPQQHVVHNK